MKRGRGGDSVEAIKEVWMEGYNRARRDLGLPPLVPISRQDLMLQASVHCADPSACPVCGGRGAIKRSRLDAILTDRETTPCPARCREAARLASEGE